MNKRSREILSQLITKTEYSQTISIQELADMLKFQAGPYDMILIRLMII